MPTNHIKKALLMCSICILGLNAADIKESRWEQGQTLLTFFEKNKLFTVDFLKKEKK